MAPTASCSDSWSSAIVLPRISTVSERRSIRTVTCYKRIVLYQINSLFMCIWNENVIMIFFFRNLIYESLIKLEKSLVSDSKTGSCNTFCGPPPGKGLFLSYYMWIKINNVSWEREIEISPSDIALGPLRSTSSSSVPRVADSRSCSLRRVPV